MQSSKKKPLQSCGPVRRSQTMRSGYVSFLRQVISHLPRSWTQQSSQRCLPASCVSVWDLCVSHIMFHMSPGKHQGAANALSRAPASTPERVVCRASRSIYNSGNSQSTCHSHKTTRNLRGTEGGWRMQPSTSSLLAWVAWLRLISHSFTHTGKEEATSLFYMTYSCMMTA